MQVLTAYKLDKALLLLLRYLFSSESKPSNKMDSKKIIIMPFTYFLLLSVISILNKGASIALLKKNAYPSQIFIGDTFCYFAGIVLCLSAIIGIFLSDKG